MSRLVLYYLIAVLKSRFINSLWLSASIAERQTYLLGTPVDTLLRVLRNNALLEAKHFACFVVNIIKSVSHFKNVTYCGATKERTKH